MTNIGKKIVVVGVSAVGKSTFARLLSDKLQVPLTHIDAIMWQPGWNYVGDETTVEKLLDISSGASWIIEGYIAKGARPSVFERADTILYLDYPPVIATKRYIQRWFKHRKRARPELEGSPDTFSFKFLKLVWTKGEAISLDKLLNEGGFETKIVRIRSPKEAKRFLADLGKQ